MLFLHIYIYLYHIINLIFFIKNKKSNSIKSRSSFIYTTLSSNLKIQCWSSWARDSIFLVKFKLEIRCRYSLIEFQLIFESSSSLIILNSTQLAYTPAFMVKIQWNVRLFGINISIKFCNNIFGIKFKLKLFTSIKTSILKFWPRLHVIEDIFNLIYLF